MIVCFLPVRKKMLRPDFFYMRVFFDSRCLCSCVFVFNRHSASIYPTEYIKLLKFTATLCFPSPYSHLLARHIHFTTATSHLFNLPNSLVFFAQNKKMPNVFKTKLVASFDAHFPSLRPHYPHTVRTSTNATTFSPPAHDQRSTLTSPTPPRTSPRVSPLQTMPSIAKRL